MTMTTIEDEDDEDEDLDDEEDGEEDERRGRRLGRMIEKERRAVRHARVDRFGRRRLQRRRRQRLPRAASPRAHTRRPRRRRHRRQRQLSRAPPPARASTIARDFGLRHEIIQHRASWSGPSTAPIPTNRCYYCKHELYTHLSRIAARAARGHRRRQQRRRPRRLPARPPGGARVRRPQPARRSRSAQRRNPRAVAAGRPADLGRAGVRVPVVARSRITTKSPTKSCGPSSGRSRRCATSAFACFACATTMRWRALEIARDEMARALEPEIARGDRARAEGRRLSLRQPRSPGLPHRQPERGTAAAAGVIGDSGWSRRRFLALRADAVGGVRDPSSAYLFPNHSKISIRSTSRSACGASTSRTTSRTRPATRCSFCSPGSFGWSPRGEISALALLSVVAGALGALRSSLRCTA